MAPSRPNRAKFNYSEATLTSQIPCPHCGKTFKVQGFKKHEASCKKQREDEKEREEFTRRYEAELRRARHKAKGKLMPGPASGPEEDQAGPSRIPSTSEPSSAMIEDPPLYVFDDTDDERQTGPDDWQPDARMRRVPSDASMGTRSTASIGPHQQPAISIDRPGEFRTEYHPRSGRPPVTQSYEEFGAHSTIYTKPADEEPFCPFRTHGDFEFVEIALDAALNQAQVDRLLDLIDRVAKGAAKVTLKNEVELRKACDNAAAELTPFSKHPVTATYKKQPVTYEVHTQPVWEWALDLLDNPLLAPYFVWDAECLYKHNGTEYERFYHEPWTADHWWDIQSSLPSNVENAIPFAFILYADKTKLSSHGTVKGYPVVVHCANLPVDIRNGKGLGGGCVVGWLPIVPEDAEEEGKLGYTNLKRVVWHESFVKLLEAVALYSQTGYAHTCYDQLMCWLFPLILILSADYEEQANACARSALCPSTSFTTSQKPLRFGRWIRVRMPSPINNVFWKVTYSCPHGALSFDRLHYLHASLWGKHLLGEIKKILNSLRRQAEAAVESFVSEFPQWRQFTHFQTVIKIMFSDGNKMADLSKQVFYATLNVLTRQASPEGHQLLLVVRSYLQLDSLIGLDVHTEHTLDMIEAELLIFNKELEKYMSCVKKSNIEGLKLDWDFPKVHLWKHVVRDIQSKGTARNYSTRPNEGMHGPLHEAYQRRSNGRDVAGQILRVDHHKLAAILIRARMDNAEQWKRFETEDPEGSQSDSPAPFEGHTKLGSACKPVSLQHLETDFSPSDRAFEGFRKKFTEFLNTSLPAYGHQLTRWIVLPSQFQVKEHRYLKVNYESTVDWRQNTDHLRCNPSFFGQPRYDAALIQLTPEKTAFVRLIFMFVCDIPDISSFQFALVQPCTAGIGGTRQLDRDFRLNRVKAVPRSSSISVPMASFIRGAVLVSDTEHRDEYFVFDHLDGDMFLRTLQCTGS
ncbi:hypothetical protein PAXRUDRAFT_9570 [Paxillus rubicundulus Ve08.2h10]|uniref:C2HC/C3H-type domain-containing protein n=1 Tax=Paxillus rubicundulus Ve08.2h10 TaxID=930991 RepID=A0A0D0E2X6_9AGAM|nr:hypothetical protein PAXRUDRAFT_9570 [Paxillus rubicundulus Ve08.2h10]